MPGVYISYPFCSQKCTFCNFASGVSSPGIRHRYQIALLAELRAHRWRWKPDTIYFGGGTPSLMPGALLAELLQAVPLADRHENTLECAPGTLTPALASEWRRLGINRISLGVQSFVTAELTQTGRRHTAKTVEHDLALLRQSGLSNINVDLIAGLPGQTRASWTESLDWIQRLRPPHVSVYIFELDDDSRLGREALLGGSRYGAAILPSDDLTAELYEQAVSRLNDLGIHRYEISNFAISGSESKHNLKYWTLAPYVGFGLDAHSFDGALRWSTADAMDEYLAGVRPSPVPSSPTEERFFVGLRLSAGIQPTADEWRDFAEPIAKWLASGMLERRGSTLRLSDRGVLLSNEVLQDFVHAA